MPQVSVSLQEVESFEKAATKIKDSIGNLTSAQQGIATLVNNVSDAQKKVSDTTQKLNDVTHGLSEAIRSLEAKIKIKKALKIEKEAELLANPEKVLQLLSEIKKLASEINRLEAQRGKCVATQACLTAHKIKLTEFSTALSAAKRSLDEIGPTLVKCKTKVSNNTDQALSLLKKIEVALERYFAVRNPIVCGSAGIYGHRAQMVDAINKNPNSLCPNGYSTKRIGNYGEMRTSVEMHEKRYFELTKAPVDLDEKLTHGIDHVFFKDGVYYICDSKCGPGAHLEPMTATGPQLSDTWTNARLDRAVGKEVADIIREKMIFEPESVKRFVSKINMGAKTVYESVDENGQIFGEGDDLDVLFE